MIRDSQKIYGEPNDINTVLANNELGSNHYVVGAGNKGVKEYNPGSKRILLIDENGNATSISYDMANKAIGTDENGNIVLKDYPHEYTFFKFGGDTNQILTTVYTSDTVSSTETADNKGNSIIEITKTDSTMEKIVGTIEFDRALVLNQSVTINVCTMFNNENGLDYLEFIDQYNSGHIIVSNKSGANTTMTLPAGTYKKIKFTENLPSGNITESVIFNCLVVY